MILETVTTDECERDAEFGTVLFTTPRQASGFVRPSVYGLCDPRTPRRIRYVGQSACPIGRYESHCYGNSAGAAIREWLRGLRAEGLWPIMLLIWQADSPDQLEGAEARWISRLKARGMADLNVAPVCHIRRIRDVVAPQEVT